MYLMTDADTFWLPRLESPELPSVSDSSCVTCVERFRMPGFKGYSHLWPYVRLRIAIAYWRTGGMKRNLYKNHVQYIRWQGSGNWISRSAWRKARYLSIFAEVQLFPSWKIVCMLIDIGYLQFTPRNSLRIRFGWGKSGEECGMKKMMLQTSW